MNRNIMSLTLAAVACGAIAIAAQAPGATASQNTPVARVTIIGCVEPADQSASGAVGTSGRTNDTKYHLTHAKDKNASKDSATKSESQTASTYRLDARDATLSPEVGHQVEIVAVIAEPETPAPAGTSGSRTAMADTTPKLRVETIRMIAPTCPE